jgi:hypothetical protein
VHVAAFARALDDDPNVATVAYEMLDGVVALVVRTRHPLAASGVGYRVGQVPRDGTDTVYVDFAPDLRGAAATPMADGEIGGRRPPQQPLPAPVAVAEATPGATPSSSTPATAGTTRARSPPGPREGVVLRGAARQGAARGRGRARDHDARRRHLPVAAGALDLRHHRPQHLRLDPRQRRRQPLRPRHRDLRVRPPARPGQIERAIRENGGGDVGAARTAEAERIAADIAGDILRETQLNYSLNLAELVQERLVGAPARWTAACARTSST